MRELFSCTSVVLLSGIFCAFAIAQDDSRPDLTGKWQLEPSKSDMQLNKLSDLTMVITEKDGSISINEDEKTADGK